MNSPPALFRPQPEDGIRDPPPMALKIQEDGDHCQGYGSSSGFGGWLGTGVVMRDGERRIEAGRCIAIVRLQQALSLMMGRRALMWLDEGSALKQVSDGPIQSVKCADPKTAIR